MSSDGPGGDQSFEKEIINLRLQLQQIYERVNLLEQRISTRVVPASAPPASPSSPPPPLPVSAQPVVTHADVVPSTTQTIAREHVVPVGATAPYGVAAAPAAAPPVLPPPMQPRPVHATAPIPPHRVPQAPVPLPANKTLEAQIGLSVAAWVGGLVFFVGVLFFLKYAWDQGWLRLSPMMRFYMALTCGAGLVAVGQLLHFRKARILSAVLMSMGVAVLMASLWGGYAFFSVPLISSTTAFVGVFLVGVAGVAMGMQTRLMVLPILALLGLYLSPVILNSGQDRSLALMLYLLAVTGMGLALSFLKRRWWPLRLIAFVSSWLWVVVWSVGGPVLGHQALALTAACVTFGLFLAESIAALHRAYGTNDDPAQKTSPNTLVLDSGLAILSLFNTVLVSIVLAVVFNRLGMKDYWMVPLALAGVHGLVMWATPSKAFSAAMSIQAVALLALAVPLYFERASIAFAWAVLTLVFAVFSFVRDSLFARIWAMVLVALTAGYIFIVEPFDSTIRGTLFEVANIQVTGWMLLGWGAALHAMATGWLTSVSMKRFTVPVTGDVPVDSAKRSLGFDNYAGVYCAVIGTVAWLIVSVAKMPGFEWLTLALLVWAAAWAVGGMLLRSDTLEKGGIVMLSALSLKWLFFDGLLPSEMARDIELVPRVLTPLANLWVLNGAVLVGLIAMQSRRTIPAAVKAWWITVMVFAMVNLEALRYVDTLQLAKPWLVKNVVLSVLWALTGFGFVIVGFARKTAAIRYVGLTLLGITVAKVLLIDMADSKAITRILSFLALGVVLLLVSLVYHRVMKQMK